MEFKLNKEFIELDNMLKAMGLAASGSEAGEAVREGLVKVNGEPETRVRRKLKAGDEVEFKGEKIYVFGGKRDFDTAAPTWDIPERVKMAEEIASAIVAHVPLTHEMDVLDFGCGTGLLSLALRPKVRSVTGADSSKGMLGVFNEKLVRGRVKGVRTVWLNPEKELTLGGPYNVVVSAMTLHHIKDIEPVLKSLREALVPGGYLAVADLDWEGGLFHNEQEGVFHNGFDREALAETARKVGFTDVRFEQAARLEKPGKDGVVRAFSIFLLLARK